MSIQGRIEAIEKKVNGEVINSGGELYDWAGEPVTDAKVIKMPTKASQGIAIMPDGTRRGIHADISLLDVLMERRKQAEADEEPRPEPTAAEVAERQERDKTMLFLRKGGVAGFVETLLHNTTQKRGVV